MASGLVDTQLHLTATVTATSASPQVESGGPILMGVMDPVGAAAPLGWSEAQWGSAGVPRVTCSRGCLRTQLEPLESVSARTQPRRCRPPFQWTNSPGVRAADPALP